MKKKQSQGKQKKAKPYYIGVLNFVQDSETWCTQQSCSLTLHPGIDTTRYGSRFMACKK